MTKNEIRCLVDRLGFKISWPLCQRKYDVFELHDKKTGKLVHCYNKLMYDFYWFSGYENLEEELLGYIYEFQAGSGKKFKNPCLGCKSFEEACMKIDLLAH